MSFVIIGLMEFNKPANAQCLLEGRVNCVKDSVTVTVLNDSICVSTAVGGRAYLFFFKTTGCYLGSLVLNNSKQGYDLYFGGLYGDRAWWGLVEDKFTSVRPAVEKIIAANPNEENEVGIDLITAFWERLTAKEIASCE